MCADFHHWTSEFAARDSANEQVLSGKKMFTQLEKALAVVKGKSLATVECAKNLDSKVDKVEDAIVDAHRQRDTSKEKC